MHSSTVSAAKNLFYLSGSNSLQRIFGTLSFLLLMRHLTLTDFGVLNLTLSFTAPLLALFSIGMASMVGTEISIARGRSQELKIVSIAKSFLTINLSTMLVIYLLGFLGFLISSTFSSIFFNYKEIFLLFSILLFFQTLSSYCELLLKSYEKFGAVASAGLTEVTVRFVLLSSFLFFFGLTLTNVLVAYIVARLVTFIVTFALTLKILKRIFSQKNDNPNVIVEIIKQYGKWGIINDIFSQCTESVRLWLVGILLNTESIAIFTAASKATSFIAKAMPVGSILKPLVSRLVDNRTLVVSIIQKARKYYTLYCVLVASLFSLFISFVLSMFAPQYVMSVLIFQLMTVRLVISGFFVGQPAILFAHLSQRFLFYQFILSFAANLITNIFFIYMLGLPGLAIAMSLNALASSVAREWYIIHKLKYRFQYLRNFLSFNETDKEVLLLFVNRFSKIVKKLT